MREVQHGEVLLGRVLDEVNPLAVSLTAAYSWVCLRDMPDHSHVCGWVHIARPGQGGPRAKSDSEPASVAAPSQPDPLPGAPTVSTPDEGPPKLGDLD